MQLMVSSAMDFTFKFDWIEVADYNNIIDKGNETWLMDDNGHH